MYALPESGKFVFVFLSQDREQENKPPLHKHPPGVWKALTGVINAEVKSLASISLLWNQDIRNSGETSSSVKSPVNLISLKPLPIAKTEQGPRGLTVWGWRVWFVVINTVGLGFKENIDTAETLIKRVQFFRRKISRVTSGSAFLSITCVENRTGNIMWSESGTQWNMCRGLLDLEIAV